ncbi:MAG TPA: RNA 2',3'-cyclic phosphodiesterase [Dongiaceae bacterium]|nr:RNA 2',3'-cyclic phosphodiesterase [Dongiaceae bacterium]
MRRPTVNADPVEGIGPPAAEGSPARSSERLFVALALPDSVKADLAGLAEPLRGVSWTRPAQLHLTLRFLGDVTADGAGRIEERLAAIRVESFIIPVEGLGAFPPKGPPRVIWVGVGAGHPHLFQLRQRLDDALLATGIDFDVRFFQPHITLARCDEGGAPAFSPWLRRHRDFSAGPFKVRAFDLCSSRLSPQGAEHGLKRRFPLA